MVNRLVVPMDDKPSLDELFVFADIDDVSEGIKGDVVLEFTMRQQFGSARLEVHGDTIEEALEHARTDIRREIRLNMLKEEGLTVADIDKIIAQEEAEDAAARVAYLKAGEREEDGVADHLTDAEHAEAAAWDRGYDAARQDLLERLNAAGIDPKVMFNPEALFAATSEPAVATAAEPVEALEIGGVELLMQGHPLISVVYMPVAITQSQSLPVGPGARILTER